MEKIFQFGTFDVNNYGDLLFPLIAQREISDGANFSLLFSSPVGGAPDYSDCVDSLRVSDVLARGSEIDAVLIGGGNIIHCERTALRDYSERLTSLLAYNDLWVSSSLGVSDSVPVLWNAPGVPQRFEREHHGLVRCVLERADYLSVRDQGSKDYLLEVWGDADIQVVPDTAWMMDLMWAKEELEELYREVSLRLGLVPSDPIVVLHVNDRYVNQISLGELALILDDISISLSARPVIVPIGMCHLDNVISENVAEKMKTNPVIFDKSKSLQEIAAVISHSKAYIGSSMHGAITASVYGVPNITVTDKKKVKFIGLAEFSGCEYMNAGAWGEARDLVSSNDFMRMPAALSLVRDKAHSMLEEHWAVIISELSVKEFSSRDVTPGMGEKFKVKMLTSQREVLALQYNALLKDAQAKVASRDEEIVSRDKAIASRDEEIVSHDEEIASRDKAIASRDEEIASRDEAIASRDEEIASRDEAIASRDEEIVSRDEEIASRDKAIVLHKQKIRRYKNSISWKFTKPFRKFYKQVNKFRKSYKQANKLMRVPRFIVRCRGAITGYYLDDGNLILGRRWFKRLKLKGQLKTYLRSGNLGDRRIVVYTAIFGEYDTLLMPEVINENCDYVCFTDKPRHNYGLWEIRLCPYYHMDTTRMARYVKTHPHLLLSGYDYAIWVDGNISFSQSFNTMRYIDRIKNEGTFFGTVEHPLRDCVYKEAVACKQLGKDGADVIDTQMRVYKDKNFKSLRGLYETNFMVISLQDEIIKNMFAIWWQQIDNYSKRDQLGLPWALFESGAKASSLLSDGVCVRQHTEFHYFTHKQCRLLSPCSALMGLGGVKSPFDKRRFVDVKEKRLEAVAAKSVDVIVCVYNALEDVKECLSSVVNNLLDNHTLIIVNDCSDIQTTKYLAQLSANNDRITLIENQVNMGYTKSANIGLKASSASFKVLLNSDTIVSENWTLKMLDAANMNPKIGVVGVLSNAAGKQTIPTLEKRANSNNSVVNELPSRYGPADIDGMCEEWCIEGVMPIVPLIHGFCFGIKSEVIDAIGYFDEINFKKYYGEENDFCFRASMAGYEMTVATNTFVYHRKSSSIQEEERVIHMSIARSTLHHLYGEEVIKEVGTQLTMHHMLKYMRGKAAEVW